MARWEEDYLDARGDVEPSREMEAEMEYDQWQRRQETYNKARIQSLSDYGRPVWVEPEDSNIGEVVVGNNLYVFSLTEGNDPQSSPSVSCRYSTFDRKHEYFGSDYVGDFTENVAWENADPNNAESLADGMKKYIADQTAGMDVGVGSRPLPGDAKYQGMHPDDAETVMLYEKWNSFTDPSAVTQAIYDNRRYRSANSQALMPFEHDDLMDILNSPYVESHFVPYVEQMHGIATVEAQLRWRDMYSSEAAQRFEDTLAGLAANERKEYQHILELIHPNNDGGDGGGAAGGAGTARELDSDEMARRRRLPDTNGHEDDEAVPGRRVPEMPFPCDPDPDEPELGM